VTRTIRAIFAEIEDLDPDKFVAHFADNVVFRFGNGEPVVGRAALRELLHHDPRPDPPPGAVTGHSQDQHRQDRR